MLKKWISWWVVPVLIVFSLGTVWLRLFIVKTAYEIGQTDREIRKARQEKELLQVKVAALKTPRRLEALGKKQFGLSPPRVDQVVYLKNSPAQHPDQRSVQKSKRNPRLMRNESQNHESIEESIREKTRGKFGEKMSIRGTLLFPMSGIADFRLFDLTSDSSNLLATQDSLALLPYFDGR